ncbi:Complex1-LYR-dom domain-containing protein [Fusarium sp. LHS14.1]|nr:Complex1-LYR-dom domain-containing protein [Fusarium sp. LHS14.1]
MPRPNAAIPDFLPPLHLYRHLLRECSYLPPAFSPTITSIIQTRFRNHRRNHSMKKKHRAKASNALRTLRAANCGDRPSMEKLMYHGFGRMGFRRRSLVADFVRPEGPNDSDALEALINGNTTKGSAGKTDSTAAELSKALDDEIRPAGRWNNKPVHIRNDFYEKWDLDKVTRLLSSQRDLQKNSTLSWLKRKIKGLKPSGAIPKTNLWGKPLAVNVIRAKEATFWRRAVNKMMVPLGNGEWELLEQLSQGAQEKGEWKVPTRRPAASPVQTVEQNTMSNWNWEAYASLPASRVERRPKKSSFVRPEGKDEEPYQAQHKKREISSRWYRRAYQRTWQFTPKMEQDPRTLKPNFTWGTIKKTTVCASNRQLCIFDGVDKQGWLIKPKTETEPSDQAADPARAGDHLAI